MAKTTTNQTNQPKTVALSTYIQSMVIAVLVTGVLSFVASYFLTINLHGNMRQAIIDDMRIVSKSQQ